MVEPMNLKVLQTLIALNLLVLLSNAIVIQYDFFKNITGDDTGWYNALAAPSDIIVTSSHSVYVIDEGNFTDPFGNNGRIFNNYSLNYSSNLTFIAEGGVKFTFPRAIAVGSDSRIYVSNTNINRVEILSPTGTFMERFGLGGVLDHPTDIFVDVDFIYVADTGHNRIAVFNTNDRLLVSTIGFEKGIGDNQLDAPQGVFVKNDKVYVADTGNKRIQIFNKNLTYLYSIGRGSGGLQVQNPVGLYVDDKETIYLTDTVTNTLYVIAPNLTILFTLGNTSNGNFNFKGPRGVYVRDDLIYVADTGNRRVQVFKLNTSVSNITSIEAVAAINDAALQISKLRTTQEIGKELNISVTETSAIYLQMAQERYIENNHSAAYDNAISATTEADRANNILKEQITAKLTERLNKINNRINLAKNTSSSYQLNLSFVLYETNYKLAQNSLSNASFKSTLSYTSQLEADLSILEDVLKRKVQDLETVKTSLKNEILEIKANLSSTLLLSSKYQQKFEVAEINLELDKALNSTNELDIQSANVSLLTAKNLLEAKKAELQIQVNKIDEALNAISKAEEAIARTEAQAFIIKPDVSAAKTTVETAKAIAYTDPIKSKEIAINALSRANTEERNFNNLKLLIQITILLVVISMIVIGGMSVIYFLSKFRRKKKKKR
ncbi:hypothetical protein HY570_03265 [Candidatus Micrarchaeota archaeon]|nr:hypothetical protein [Candidatus Micrarchaeota archaeon]